MQDGNMNLLLPPPDPIVPVAVAVCAYCERTHRVNANGRMRKHRCPASGKACHGSGILHD